MNLDLVTFVDKLLDFLDSGNYVGILLVLAFSVLINLPKITEYYLSHKRRRLDTLTKLQNLDGLDPRLKRHIKSEIEVEVFRLTHKVKVSMVLLNGLLSLKERVGDQVSFKHILRCGRIVPDLSKVSEPNFQIKIEKLDYAYAIYNSVFGLLGFFVGFFWFTYSVATLLSAPNFQSIFVSSLMLLVGFGMLTQTTPVYSTRIINKQLLENRVDSGEKSL
ncbi:hypothetical protein P3631_23525 [Vibrio parahaemolyticus]|uniref:hypothetical protein n=1 Tax=Vibrio parahaemolyticus TaxID=670 RepID=UPI00146AA52E|nr:hypothetical protein [Vibrio parahaemolyticus]MDF5093916.1 hypothetical protein [Vibrio parahaemolyticus]MDF5138895.1 hypothetical protein [Vibrio parahaemolyticus]NMU19414.1 hypothetical protein [Vibrio parahaemolyticus]NMU54099.1 hypothetical protein [Vibrio parahaemolyticus]